MKWTRRKFIKGGLLLAGGAVLADSLWFENYFIETNELCIGNSTNDHFDLKVIQISDLHLQELNGQLKKLAIEINAQKADLIVITGDSIDSKKNTFLLDQFLRLLDHGTRKFAILGNWEYWGEVNIQNLKSIYAEHNCDLLINESKQLKINDKTISITGIDDYIGGKADIDKALIEFKSADCHLILNHCPAYGDIIFDKLNGKVAYDLMLSGHTHGGQINLFGFVPFKPPGSGDYLKGWYPDKKIYVSKGIGTSILPARFRARAEMTIFKISA